MKYAIRFTRLLRRPAAVAGSVPIKLPVLASAIAFSLSLGFLIFSSVLLPASQEEGPQPSVQLQDGSRLTISVVNVRVLVIDKEGRKTGFDPITGVELEEIPNSVYFVDRIDNDVTGETDPNSTAFANITQPADGVYEVVVSGDALAAFSLHVDGVSRDGNMQPRISVDVVVGADGTASFEVQFASSPGAISRLVVTLDIKPGSDPNSMDPDDLDAVITVAIVTDQSFDATTVDQTTVRFGKMGTEAVQVHSNAHEQDVDNDGDTDLVFHFRFGDTGLACGDTEAKLTGETSAGTPIAGKDAIRTVGC